MRPEKKERVFDNEPYCKSCRRSENFCQCNGHNSCHDLHTEWFKSQEFKDELDALVGNCRYLHDKNNDIGIGARIDMFISKYLGGKG